ncbi:4Fe-4S single cluster domain containing protein [uncultured Caudovirales phage]|uniref:4Fe-4S single cluster domain containing protein n=1 Tax=uncultured Caudovirales phage TaxID=2100421 RepID=A0A6J5P4U8_9CAUD|nr:4Fe-4S single cluster domain containing protein [uncultured Caudovirales phage]CAB4165614.1 4Fe-4S single cluster domain containing protein [uncultured Caudovirales phage]CAB4186735.1 4Fe-4S single cluster domain containing protein [uncultured Caudovirales phage]CAB4220801.1 4Fe-4S single cluster domain containing protein [uncultured Caudovirales phage]
MDTFCVLPWFGREITWNQAETHCCLLPKHYNIETIKTAMLAGKKPTECQKCWNMENQGLQSDRQLKNSALDVYWDRDLPFIKQDAIDGKHDVNMLKLITSYTCNATCVSCGSESSSSWAQLDHRMYPTIPIQRSTFIDIDLVKQKINLKELKMLSLIGGEPLYEKRNFELLEHLIDLGNNTVFLSMVTNGSVRLTTKQKKTLEKFKNLNFCISVDGTESVFEYLRFPLKWQDLLDNLKFFYQITDNISSNYTLSNLNVLYHNQTVDWFNQNKIPFSNNPVYSPVWLQPRTLPAHIKQHLKEVLSIRDFNTYIGSTHNDTDQQYWEECLKQIAKQDAAKGIEWKTYLPELYNMLT